MTNRLACLRAEVHSDDRVVEVEFDAQLWFDQASDDEIAALRDCDFGGDYPADAVALFAAEHDEGVRRLFTYLDILGAGNKPMGFECHVVATDAETWLAEHGRSLLTVCSG